MNTTDTQKLAQAFDYFNRVLWVEQGFPPLPPAIIILQRHKGAYGYFHANNMKHKKDGNTNHEIAINPNHFLDRDDIHVLGTLVHEMCHLWQECFGKPSRTSYHNQEWANEMERVGLIPTATGQPNGKKTGQKMTHLIDGDGLFRKVALDYIAVGFELSWGSPQDENVTSPAKSSKVKYTCPSCEMNVWGKPNIRVQCMDCGMELTTG